MTSERLNLEDHVVETEGLVDVAVRTTGDANRLIDELLVGDDLNAGVGELFELLSDDEDGADETVVARLESGEVVLLRRRAEGGDVKGDEESSERGENVAERGGDGEVDEGLNGGGEVLLRVVDEDEFFWGEQHRVEGRQRLEDVAEAVLVAAESREGVVDGVAGERCVETDGILGGGAEVVELIASFSESEDRFRSGAKEGFVELADGERRLFGADGLDPLDEELEVELDSRGLNELRTLLDGEMNSALDVAEGALDVGSADVGVVGSTLR